MNKVIKAAVLALATAATVIPAITPAQADDWGRRNYYRHGGYDRHYRHNNDGLALGALGLATGVIIGGAIANRPRYQERVYVDPEPEYYEPRPVYRPRPVVVQNYGGLEPWSPGWYRYCSQRYRSFDAQSGTFRGYDGRDYFCTAG
ncbi:membrane protein [Pararhizobium polonicum]|uniref:Lectin-like protein BA14k n=1 Tax=Pararhizobium polonicum TaxID=1612624 RepID=A0A1C7NWI1_9HYPH|nr:BA14K family protein [Pararhizobium polonicum]OBZ93355.1 membrane protein [Pararhizobium polonicum]